MIRISSIQEPFYSKVKMCFLISVKWLLCTMPPAVKY